MIINIEVYLGILEFYLEVRKQKSQKSVYNILSQNKFVLPDLFIAVNLSKYEKALCFLYKNKKVPYNSFYKDEQFLDSDISTYFTLFVLQQPLV